MLNDISCVWNQTSAGSAPKASCLAQAQKFLAVNPLHSMKYSPIAEKYLTTTPEAADFVPCIPSFVGSMFWNGFCKHIMGTLPSSWYNPILDPIWIYLGTGWILKRFLSSTGPMDWIQCRSTQATVFNMQCDYMSVQDLVSEHKLTLWVFRKQVNLPSPKASLRKPILNWVKWSSPITVFDPMSIVDSQCKS